MRHNKNDDTTPQKSEEEKKVEALMGPPPNEARSRASQEHPEPGVIVPPEQEPAGAPIIPNEALPKEMREEQVTAASLPAKKVVEPAPTAEPEEYADPETEKAVNEIVAKESDEVLAAEDAELAKAFEPEAKPRGLSARIKHAFGAWWHNRKLRYATLLAVLVIMVAIAVVPASRYFVLNNVGVRSSANLQVLDNSTQQPLKNVTVEIAGQTVKTNEEGVAKLEHLMLGNTQLVVQRRAFAPITRNIVVGWGSNPLGDFKLIPTGSQYTFRVTDFLSGKPLADAQASARDADARADEKGVIVLTIDDTGIDTAEVIITADSYREEKRQLNLDEKSVQSIKMAPDRKHVFVTKQSGKYDLYSEDVDGKNEQLLLSGSGTERDDMVLAPHPTKNIVGFVSTRENKRNDDGYLLSTLYIINTTDGDRTEVATAEQVQVIDWISDRLVYVQITAGASASNPDRYKLMSYELAEDRTIELASSNYFNDVIAAKDKVYFAPSGAYQKNAANTYSINADGTNRQTVLSQETWNIFRLQYDTLTLSAGNNWYSYKFNDVQAGKISGQPASLASRLYRDSPDGSHSLWVDERDGKGVLLSYDVTNKKDKILTSSSGLSNPTYWLNNSYVVYRVNTAQETADYVLNLDGGEPQKIRDVTNTTGIDRWYYYR